MKKSVLLLLLVGFLASSCATGWANKGFHKENWGTPKPKKGKKGKNHSWS